MTTEFTLGERIAWYRRRRGISQEVLAGLVGRSVDWLSKIENGHIQLDRVSVLRRIAEVLDVSLGDLIAEPSLVEWTRESGQRTVPALRAVLMDYRRVTAQADSPQMTEPIGLADAKQVIGEIWDAYQGARFAYVTGRLTTFLPVARASLNAYDGQDRRLLAGRVALAHQAAASVLTKLGEADLAWSASDRGIEFATASENPAVVASLMRSVAHSLLSVGAYADAVSLSREGASYLEPFLRDSGPTLLSVYGTGNLVGAMAAARMDDRDAANGFLRVAQRAAATLGRDGNRMWTAFGPTNVAIHRVSTAVEFGDIQAAVSEGPAIDTRSVPTERRVRHALEVARALSATNRRDEALTMVLDAEQLAPEQVRYHFLSRHLVQTWVRTQRTKPPIELAQLARRLNVA